MVIFIYQMNEYKNITKNTYGGSLLKKRKIGEFINFIPGVNQSRAEKQFENEKIIYYDQSSFESDYTNQHSIKTIETLSFKSDLSLEEGDVVISHYLQLATIVRKGNVGKILPINFIKADFVSKDLNKEFFVYLFNENKNIKRQKEREIQGTGLVQRLSISSLEEFKVPNISIKEQERIGKIYFEMVTLKNNLHQYGNLLSQMTHAILEENINENF